MEFKVAKKFKKGRWHGDLTGVMQGFRGLSPGFSWPKVGGLSEALHGGI